jgi:hypothetical protein
MVSLKTDHYGFIKNGLVANYSDINELAKALSELVDNKPYIRMRAKRYCHVIDTRFDGKSAKLAARLLISISKGKVEHDTWKRLKNYKIPTYEPI